MKFTKEQIEKLEENENISSVRSGRIQYTAAFKQKAVEEYNEGKSAKAIFIEAGFNIQELSENPDYPSFTLSKWRKQLKPEGNNVYCPPQKVKEKYTKLERMQARIKYLEAENTFLKKLRALNEKFR